MASRGGGIGMVIATVILGATTLVFFVLTLAFYGQINSLKAEASDARSDIARFVRANERDAAAAVEQQAQARQMSVFGFMDERYKDAMKLVTGRDTASADDIRTQVGELPPGASVVSLVSQQRGEIQRLNDAIAGSTAKLEDKGAQLDQQITSYQRAERMISDSASTLAARVGEHTSQVEDYLQRLSTESDAVRDQLNQQQAAFAGEKAALTSEITRLTNENLILQNQLRVRNADLSGQALRGTDEYALVDGQVISTNASQNVATIDRGRRHNVVIGMVFSVYADPSVLRPDAEGNLPRGKAQLEVINVQENAATCRILRETRGNPIVRGDVVVNPYYDPNKTYKFVVFGNFDADGDGRASFLEIDPVVAQIREWGGQVLTLNPQSPDLAGDADFLVLGERPVVPPAPPSTAPIEIRAEYSRLSRIADNYDKLLNQARSTSIPILNLNRLRTLLGE